LFRPSGNEKHGGLSTQQHFSESLAHGHRIDDFDDSTLSTFTRHNFAVNGQSLMGGLAISGVSPIGLWP
jgi:hypothetical protein